MLGAAAHASVGNIMTSMVSTAAKLMNRRTIEVYRSCYEYPRPGGPEPRNTTNSQRKFERSLHRPSSD